jgi:hypothetical protein
MAARICSQRPAMSALAPAPCSTMVSSLVTVMRLAWGRASHSTRYAGAIEHGGACHAWRTPTRTGRGRTGGGGCRERVGKTSKAAEREARPETCAKAVAHAGWLSLVSACGVRLVTWACARPQLAAPHLSQRAHIHVLHLVSQLLADHLAADKQGGRASEQPRAEQKPRGSSSLAWRHRGPSKGLGRRARAKPGCGRAASSRTSQPVSPSLRAPAPPRRTSPPVSTAMSCRLALRLSPKPGALTAHTCGTRPRLGPRFPGPPTPQAAANFLAQPAYRTSHCATVTGSREPAARSTGTPPSPASTALKPFALALTALSPRASSPCSSPAVPWPRCYSRESLAQVLSSHEDPPP